MKTLLDLAVGDTLEQPEWLTVTQEMINQFLDWIENLECGVDLMNEYVFSIPTEIN